MLRLMIATAIAILIASPVQAKHRHHHHHRHHAHYAVAQDAQIVEHPSGCPRTAFCGCGVALKVFGHRVRNLYLAANWLRFPRASLAAGMVAARNHHVFYIMEVIGHNLVKAYDPNSGGHATRIHIRSVAGFRIVNPHGGNV